METTYDVQEDFASQVRLARKARGWTQRELADRTGLSLRMIQSTESGEAKPQPGNVHILRRVLDLDAQADDTRAAWTDDVHVTLDIIGHMLATFAPDEREDVVRAMVQWLMDYARQHPRATD